VLPEFRRGAEDLVKNMNDQNPNLNPQPKELTAQERTLLDKFLALPAEQMLPYLCVLHHFEQAPPNRRALALKLLNAALPGKVVAWLSGVSDRQLRRYAEYKVAKQVLRQQGSPPPRGAKSRDGEIEAWKADE
jgi:hypothetical protein